MQESKREGCLLAWDLRSNVALGLLIWLLLQHSSHLVKCISGPKTFTCSFCCKTPLNKNNSLVAIFGGYMKEEKTICRNAHFLRNKLSLWSIDKLEIWFPLLKYFFANICIFWLIVMKISLNSRIEFHSSMHHNRWISGGIKINLCQIEIRFSRSSSQICQRSK